MEVRFCETCGKETESFVQEEEVSRNVRGISFSYRQKNAYCTVCGNPVYDPDLHDEAVRADNEAYRAAAGLISVEEIHEILKKYDVGADPLANLLEIGSASLQRYLSGRLPSQKNSDILRSVLDSPARMEALLEKNREKISDVAYRKCHEALRRLREGGHNGTEKGIAVEIRMDTIDYFRALEAKTGIFYQNLINLYLKDCVANQRDPSIVWH